MAEDGRSPHPELDSFVGRYLVSFAAWDLLVLLRSQPGLRDSAEGFAYRLGRNPVAIAEALQVMLAGGLVTAQVSGEEELYSLAPGSRPLLDRFAEASANREWRLDLVRSVLARMGK